MAANDVYKKIDKLVAELGSAANHLEEMKAKIGDLTAELDALDKMADEALDRAEYDAITAQRKEAELDLRFARNRLRLFNQTPRIDPEALSDLMNQLDADAEAAAEAYRQKVERPLAEVVAAGDEFDATVAAIREGVRKLASVDGPAMERDEARRRLYLRFELGKLRSRAYTDGTIIYPGLRDALKLATSAKWEPFDTH